MAKEQTFKVVGVSRLGGEVKVRFAHEMTYVKGLSKAGNTDIELMEAPSEMTKTALTEWLKTTALYENAEFKEAIDSRLQMYAVKAGNAVKAKKVKAEKPVKAAKVTKTKAAPSLEAIKARGAKKAVKTATETVAE
jgi:hypothetical protein